MIALSENGVVFDIDNVIASGTKWAWFGTWNGNFITKNGKFSDEYTEAYVLKKTYQSKYVITLDELPDWSTYSAGTTPMSYYIAGDANCDGTVDLADVVLVLKVISDPGKYGEKGTNATHITVQGAKNADVYERGSGLTSQDAIEIQRYLLKMVHSLK